MGRRGEGAPPRCCLGPLLGMFGVGLGPGLLPGADHAPLPGHTSPKRPLDLLSRVTQKNDPALSKPGRRPRHSQPRAPLRLRQPGPRNLCAVARRAEPARVLPRTSQLQPRWPPPKTTEAASEAASEAAPGGRRRLSRAALAQNQLLLSTGSHTRKNDVHLYSYIHSTSCF